LEFSNSELWNITVNVDYALFSIAMFKQINACSDNPSTIYLIDYIFHWKIVGK